MPAIRDYSYAYEFTTTDGGLTLPMCSYAPGDLLFAILVGDTGTPTVGVTGGPGTWNQLFQRVNTCSLTVLWRYALANEVDVVMTASVAETYSGVLVAVRDVFQGYTAGSPPLQSNNTSTGTRIALPTITTSADDSLVLAIVSSSGTSSICFIEAALQSLIMVDGAAEGLGVGWFYKKSAGLTTAYNAASLASAAGGKAVIECRAPAGGATVIPPYPVSDASIVISPNLGIAYNSNTALAATADTNFGTSIAGITCNDGTVATAVTDIGIDSGSFMSFCGVTNTAVANQMSGAEGVVASSRYNVGSRNILTHFRHATPVQNQRLSPLSSGRGVWFGMRSGTTALTNWKVWQVHGSDAPLVPGYVQPIIVNAANTDTIASSGTLNGTDVRGYGIWTGGVGVLTQQAAFGPVWAMDTTIIAGGNAAEPLDIPGVVRSAARNKVRFSSTLQGSNQMLCLQAIQFGDGGTNPIFLKINGGAVEFPSRKNVAKKIVNYNGIDDSIGWTFYAGSADTIDLEGTSFASSSKYHWRVHASASASATWKMTGVAINGAGDVQLRAVTTFASMTFTNCPTVVQNGAAIAYSSFFNSTISVCNAPGLLSYCDFTSGGSGHALIITTPGTYSFVGNTFSGYGANESTAAAIYNNSGGLVVLNISGGGSTPTVRNGAGASTTVNNTVTLTLTGIKTSGPTLSTGSEVRIYLHNTTTELAGIENCTTGEFEFNYTYSAGTYVDIVVLHEEYLYYRIDNYLLGSVSGSLPIQQTPDRQYFNPG